MTQHKLIYDGFGIWYDKKGYPTIFINGKNIKLHIYIWEKANGEKPKRMQLHHIDFNKGNYSIENLELVNQSDHFKIHAGWKRGSDGNFVLKPCKDCKQLLSLNSFYQRKGLTPNNRCIDCCKKYFREKKVHVTEERKKYMRNYYKLNKNKWEIKN